jgi:hypothetical protein
LDGTTSFIDEDSDTTPEEVEDDNSILDNIYFSEDDWVTLGSDSGDDVHTH